MYIIAIEKEIIYDQTSISLTYTKKTHRRPTWYKFISRSRKADQSKWCITNNKETHKTYNLFLRAIQNEISSQTNL